MGAWRAVALAVAAMAVAGGAVAGDVPWFGVRVVDRATGRGVPAVELRLTNDVRQWTDSAGWAAFHEPGLMGTDAWFGVKADGYELPPDGFGFSGRRLRMEPNGRATIEVDRKMVAERLYRATGAGIYADSVLLGEPTPFADAAPPGRVMGQDSVQGLVWKGRVRWFWGDTSRPEYPLGQFAVSGATSLLPADGGMAPSVGVKYDYFVNAEGFSRPMVDIEGDGAKWLDGLMLVDDDAGVERLVGIVNRVKSLGENLDRTLVVYDEARDVFTHLAPFALGEALAPAGRPIRHADGGVDYFYFPTPFPHARVRATWDDIRNPRAYEGWTCLPQGARYDANAPVVERDADGHVAWAWRRDTPNVTFAQQQEMVAKGALRPDEAWIDVRDVETGESVQLWGGTVAWNDWRKAWIMIAYQMQGKPSLLGEVWFAEAQAPQGPWPLARKVATHEKYTFYNPVHHPFLDEDGGRTIYFEGTYSDLFSGVQTPTPRYNYNQIMYRLDLGDERMKVAPAAP